MPTIDKIWGASMGGHMVSTGTPQWLVEAVAASSPPKEVDIPVGHVLMKAFTKAGISRPEGLGR
jgi:hypothetical protein